MRIVLLAAVLSSALPMPAEARLAASPDALLAGKVAGAPTDCLPAFARDRETRTYASGDILYRGSGTTWYRNHPRGCPRFTPTMVFTTVTPNQLCRGDIVQVTDQVSHIFLGSCALGDFTPYSDPAR